MGEVRDRLLGKIEDAHDWHHGKARQWDLCSTERYSFCGVCGLRWNAFREGQKSADYDVFETSKGERLVLHEVAELEPCVRRAHGHL